MKHKPLRIVGIILGLLLVLAGLLAAYYFLFLNPYRGTVSGFAPARALDAALSREEAEADLEYLRQRVTSRHPAWLDGAQELSDAFDRQYRQEVSALGDTVTVLELWRASARILAQLHDGHTRARWYDPNGERRLSDVSAIELYGPPVSIDDIPTQELLQKYLEMAAYELEFYAQSQFYSRVLFNEAQLRLCGVDTTDGVDMRFETDGGIVVERLSFVSADLSAGSQAAADAGNWVAYSFDPVHDAGVFTLKSCDMNAEYRQTLHDFFVEVISRGISNVVVDLRGNGGGNSRVANEFLRYIDVDSYASLGNAVRFGWILWRNTNIVKSNPKQAETFAGSIYVLTDADTFSSAMDFAMLIRDNQLGVLVGSTPGNRPDSYGDILYFQLPNSGIALTVSYKRWYRIDAAKRGEPLTPDYVVAGGEALDRVYALIDAGR